MKKYAHITLLLIAIALTAVSCTQNKQEDSKEEAKEANKENVFQFN